MGTKNAEVRRHQFWGAAIPTLLFLLAAGAFCPREACAGTSTITVPAGPFLEGWPIAVSGTADNFSTGATFTYSWRVTKDGVDYASATDGPGLGSPDNYTFTPDDNAVYVVMLTVTDDGGVQAVADPQTINPDPVYPIVAITGAPLLSPVGAGIMLGSNVTGPGAGASLSYQWDVYGPYYYSSGTGETYTFAPYSPGIYTVTLTVTDHAGYNGSDTKSIMVTPAWITLRGGPYLEGSPIAVTGNLTNIDDGGSGFTCTWTVLKNGLAYTSGFSIGSGGGGGGGPAAAASNDGPPGDTSDFTFTPDDNGTYEILLTVVDVYGSSWVAGPQTLTVDNVAPVLSNVGFGAPPFTSTNPGSITIPDSGNGSPYPSTIDVSGVSGSVTKVTVTLNSLSHTYPADIGVLLVGPAGQSVVLMRTCGGGNDVNGVTLTFDDAASNALPFGEGSPPITSGTYKPTDQGLERTFPAPAPYGAPTGTTLSIFNSLDPNGAWSLYVEDFSEEDSGSIAGGWSLRIEIAAVENQINEGDTITLSGNIADPGKLDSFTLTVNWGDGSAAQDYALPAGSTSFSEQHKYLDNPPSGQSYTVSASIKDKDGGVGAGGGGIVNGDFENGLTGWTVAAGGIASTPESSGPVVPQSGSHFLLMDTGDHIQTTDTSLFGGTRGTVVTQSFYLPAGATLSFQWNYLTNEDEDYDFAFGDLLDSGMNVVSDLFWADYYSINDDAFGQFDYQSDWHTTSCTVASSGTYTLRFVVSHTEDISVSSGLAVDNVTCVAQELIENGGFETGDFTGWYTYVTDEPYYDWTVSEAGYGVDYDFAPTAPVEGSYDAWNGFDGYGPMWYGMNQVVDLPAGSVWLSWKERIQWDMTYDATLARTYKVQLYDNDTEDLLATLFSFSAPPGTVGDTGWVSHSVDLSAYAGMSVEIFFEEYIPEESTGPGQIEFDAITTTLIPTVTQLTLNVNNVAPTLRGGGVVYVNSWVGEPLAEYGFPADNVDAMNTVFGAGKWQHRYFETVDPASLFSLSNGFIFMDGSDQAAGAMNNFIQANLDAMQAWANAGGSLFLNCSPYTGGNFSLGFGVTLNASQYNNSVAAADPAHPIFNGPFTPVATSYTGGEFSEATVSGNGLSTILNGTDYGGVVLAEMAYGSGHILCGGMTLPSLHDPKPEAYNLLYNILYYARGQAAAASLQLASTIINEGGVASLSGTFTDPGVLDTHTVLIDWGDGGPTTTLSLAAGVLSFGPVLHTYGFALVSPSITETIAVTVTDKDGGSGSSTIDLTINNVPPTVTITGAPASSPEGSSIALDSIVTDPGGVADIVEYKWTVTGGPYDYDSNGSSNFTFWPYAPGNYTVTLTVWDSDYDSASDTKQIVIINVPPSPWMDLPGGPYPEGSPITVTGNVDDPTYNESFTYFWTVLKDGMAYTSGITTGGGGPPPTFKPADGQGQSSDFTFTPDDNGTYEICLIVIDAYGASGVAPPRTIDVSNVAPTVSNAAVTRATINEGDTVTLSGNISDPGKLDSFVLNVDWGDGSAPQTDNLPAGSTSFSVQHTYLDNPEGQPSGGTYNIMALLTDKDGASSTARSGAGASDLVNGDFEDGLTGWTVDEYGIADTWSSAGPVAPTSGSQFLLMDTGGEEGDTTDTEDYWGLCGDGVYHYGTMGTVVTQTFTLSGPALLSFQWNYLTNENQNSKYDFALGDLLDSNGDLVAHMFEANSSVGKDASGSGYDRQSGWQDASFVVPAAGTYTLLFVVTNTGDYEVNSGLAVDNIRATLALPIPVVVNNVLPANVVLSLNPATINEGGTTSLRGTFTDSGVLDTHTVNIDWGDGGEPETLPVLAAGVTSFGPVSHTYTGELGDSPITDTITVTVTDKDGGRPDEPSTIIVTITNAPLTTVATVAITGAPASSPEGTAIALTGTARAEGELTYRWVVSKNGVAGFATGTGTAFTFTPDDNGNYVVTLTVNDGSANIGSDSKGIVVTNVAPVPTIAVPANATEGTALTLSSSVADPGAADVAAGFTYLWIVSANGVPVVTGNSATLTFAPAAANYLVALSVTDKDGATGLATTTFTAANIGPQVTIVGAPASSPEGTALNLTSTVLDPGLPKDTLSYQWSVAKNGSPFGSGGAAATYGFTPDDNGSYVVSLVATDNNGASATASATIAVTNVPPMVLINNAPPRVPGGTFLFLTSTVTDPSPVDMAAGFSYFWSVTVNGNLFATGTAPSLSLATAGDTNYDVSLTVTDKDGGSSLATQTIIVSKAAPTIVSGPTAVPNPVIEGGLVQLSCTAQDTEQLTWSWDFGDGSTDNSNNSSVSHIYAVPGDYMVTVTAKDTSGYATTKDVIVTVVSLSPGGTEELTTFLTDNGAALPPLPPAVALKVVRLRIQLVFNNFVGGDSIRMTGKLAVPKGISLQGQLLALDVGGVMRKFTLDAKGNANQGYDRLKLNKRSSLVTVSLTGYSFASIMAKSGLTDIDVTNVKRSVTVTLIFNQTVYQIAKPLIYTAKEGKFGVAR